MTSSSLRITEIFYSLQGETSTTGLPTVFVRLTGCPLRCGYCDTAYAFSGGEIVDIDGIVAQVAHYHCPRVTVTGGEPLAQPECLELLSRLCDRDWRVSLETSGAMPISDVDSRVTVILDLKTPGSGESHRNLEQNLAVLKPTDEVKFVICDQQDYQWAKAKIHQYDLPDRVVEILMSPVAGQLSPAVLADWVLHDGLPVRLQVQLHKLLWGDQPGH